MTNSSTSQKLVFQVSKYTFPEVQFDSLTFTKTEPNGHTMGITTNVLGAYDVWLFFLALGYLVWKFVIQRKSGSSSSTASSSSKGSDKAGASKSSSSSSSSRSTGNSSTLSPRDAFLKALKREQASVAAAPRKVDIGDVALGEVLPNELAELVRSSEVEELKIKADVDLRGLGLLVSANSLKRLTISG